MSFHSILKDLKRSPVQNVETSCKSFAGINKAEFTSTDPFFLTVISIMELAMLFRCDCFKLMHKNINSCVVAGIENIFYLNDT